MGMQRRDLRRYEALRRIASRHKDGRFWYAVTDARPFKKGIMIWINTGPSVGRHEVLISGHHELLVRPVGKWEFYTRLWRGRLRRWWLRLKRRWG